MGLIYLAGSVPKGTQNKENFLDRRKEFERKFTEKIGNESNTPLSGVRFLDPNTGGIEIFPLPIWFGRDVHMIYVSELIIVEAQEKLGIGTAQEMMVAKYYKKPVIAIAPENSHYNKYITTPSTDKFHYTHPFLLNTSDLIVSTQEEAIQALVDHFTGKKIIHSDGIDVIEYMRKEFVEKYMDQDEYFIEKLEE